jgi:hypothetical protein
VFSMWVGLCPSSCPLLFCRLYPVWIVMHYVSVSNWSSVTSVVSHLVSELVI